ncbi:hypothetical protein [Nocardia miyunensis]|uniref:hypothetical protein n=1 Tax=Nocardia miyunensis TaxID=282684 RepID=UPI0008350E50|nr:hypothetical protein [Nocardia miyunensis]
MTEKTVDIWIPEGYLEMPLKGIDEHLKLTQELLDEVATPALRTISDSLIPVAAFFLNLLADRDTRYCGIGRHQSPDGEVITSCLTVCVYEMDGDKPNPRVMLKNLVDSRNEFDDDLWISEPIDVDGRPMMFSERTAHLPAPRIDGLPSAGDTVETYQLEATVPADDGTAIAAVELSVPGIEHGPGFQETIFDMARSIRFRPSDLPSTRPSSLNL